jgi:hypothetical protein
MDWLLVRKVEVKPMNSRVALIVLAALLVGGCQDDSAATKPSAISYFQDSGLCFAGVDSFTYGGYKVISITNVPCTPQVLESASKGERP